MKNAQLLFSFFIFICASSFSQTITLHSISNARQPGGAEGYTLDGQHMLTSSREKLLHQYNFSPTGIYPKSININDGYFTAASLEQITTVPTDQIFFFGAFNLNEPTLQQFSTAEIDSLYNWSKRGGKLIIGATPAFLPYNPSVLNSKWGFDLTLGNVNFAFDQTTAGSNTDIYKGPFGIIISAWEGGSAQGFFNMIPTNSVVLATHTDGTPTLIMDCNTLDLITADVDGYTSVGGVSQGPVINLNQDIFWANTIVFMDKLQPPPIITNHYDTLRLNASYNSYQWYFNNDTISGATNQIYLPTEFGNYTVAVTVNGGCKVTSDSLLYDTLENISMPNVFTPNNDYFNDIFNPIQLTRITIDKVSIFNRWGNMIHEEDSPEVLWDGKSGDKDVSEGTYYWIIEYQNKQSAKKEKHGYVQLIR